MTLNELKTASLNVWDDPGDSDLIAYEIKRNKRNPLAPHYCFVYADEKRFQIEALNFDKTWDELNELAENEELDISEEGNKVILDCEDRTFVIVVKTLVSLTKFI